MVAVTGAIEIAVHGWDISVACGARRPRVGPETPEPGPQRRPVRGDSRESGWSISVGRQTSGAELGKGDKTR
jgi:hypothetical protein